VPGTPVLADGRVSVPFTSLRPVKRAQLHYTSDGGLRSKRVWHSVEAEVGDGVVRAPAPPAAANTWIVSLTDDRGARVSTPVQFQ
jgi:hypothetical protein